MNLKGMLFGILLGSSAAFGQYKANINNSDYSFIEKDLIDTIDKQEKMLGIKHFGRPKIFFIPGFSGLAASYDGENNRIYFRIYHKIILAHELGHFYPDRLSESLGKGDWPVYEKFPWGFAEGEKGKKIISEGVANYFGVRTFGNTSYGNKLKLRVKNFDSYLDSLGTDSFYDVGYFLVKPILDISVRKGVEYLLTNTPTDKELGDILAYKERILREFRMFISTK